MKVSSNRKLAFMLFRELLEKSKGSLFDIHCGMWTSINEMSTSFLLNKCLVLLMKM